MRHQVWNLTSNLKMKICLITIKKPNVLLQRLMQHTPTLTEAPTPTPAAAHAPRSGDSASGDNEDTIPRMNYKNVELLIVDLGETDGFVKNELEM